jgi:copper resistance protein D
MGVAQTLALCRFVNFGAALFLFGAFAYLAMLVPKHLARDVAVLLRPAQEMAALAVLVSTAGLLPLTVASIGDGWADVLSWSTTHDVLFETDIGTAWFLRTVSCALVVLAVVASEQPAWTALAAAILLLTMPLAGHASMQQGLVGLLHRFNDSLHLLAAGAWVGALVPLLLILGRIDQPDWQHAAAQALRSFSLAGHFAVAIVLTTGVVNALLVLGHLPMDWTSPYQGLLAAKIALVLIMLSLAVLNRYILVPRLRRRPAACRALLAATLVEIGIGLAVLGLVSAFGLLDPI